ncbi:putative MORN repeat [Trypanosoma vivax]|uniref:MORN repeat-containing protein n=1 Tax=Trypanosoma vivax (strain Y486) TaxID=1055687 RepID=G0U6R5_TRYVY|nr:hypothetical protein TRVL_01530 [Trypanosoma vivax]KAH8611612.1 putative MORN repeat [Trypanosoma vivax]CCC51569.1 conserved hypothetical protein [Trypanosoma vivax Y486]
MLTITEEKVPIPLIPDVELCDVRVGATDPALFFRISLSKPYQVIIEFQEFNTVARCMLLLSPTDQHPSKHTAVWKHLSPDPKKTLSILPADPSYQVGSLYLAVRYVEPNGNTFVRLKLTLREEYEAEWYSLVNNSLYYGMWRGFCYHGFGRIIYGVQPAAVEDGAMMWSGKSLRSQSSKLSWRVDFAPVVESALLNVPRSDLSWSILVLPMPGTEMYDGEWVNGRKEGIGVYQWGDRSYWGMWKDGKRHGFGVFTTAGDFRYEGEWLCDKKHGLGKAFYADGSKYQGEWEDGCRSGHGLFIYPNRVTVSGTWKEDTLCSNVTANYTDSSFYLGEWKDGCRHGNGKHTDALGNVFVGRWENDRRSGTGTLTFVNGVVCVATWVSDERTDGVFTFPNGEVYVGEWDDVLLLRDGVGHCTYPNGDEYEGNWSKDLRDGFGTLVEACRKQSYSGEWHMGKRHGLGIQKTDSGTYHGEFRDDFCCGRGFYMGLDGSMYRGYWKDGAQVGHGVLVEADSNTQYEGLFLLGKLQSFGSSRSSEDMYEGTWLDGKRQGLGVTSLPNGDVVHCLWHRGVAKDGYVLYKYRDGNVYEGGWANGQRCGHGTLRYADGSVFVGEWLNDKPHGHGCYTDARGEAHNGVWENGIQQDVCGIICFVDGSVYHGSINNGKPEGMGRLSYPDGTRFEGVFRVGTYKA